MKKYDLVVIGSGPAGEKGAVKAAYFGRKVALIEKGYKLGGSGVQAALPSKTLKQTALYLSGKWEKGLYGIEKKLAHDATIQDFMFRKNFVTNKIEEEVHQNLRLHGVDLYHGLATIDDPNHVRVVGTKEEVLETDFILIATGSYPTHPEGIPFEDNRVRDSDSILELQEMPRSMCIVGAGVIGCEYATIFATMGCQVYLINRSDVVLPHLDRDISKELLREMEESGVEMLYNKTVEAVDLPNDPTGRVNVRLASGELLHVDTFLYAAGRGGQTNDLRLEEHGVRLSKRGRIEVNEEYRTTVSNIFAAGDVIGFPALASTSMDQGRAAVSHMFQLHDLDELNQVLPYGIYTIPEVAMVGLTEHEAAEQGLQCEVGLARYDSVARGQIMGCRGGVLKLVFTKADRVIQGVHCVGPYATELIHYGVTLVEGKKTLHYIAMAVFNFPTLHELYKGACYDGLSNLAGHKVKEVLLE